MFLFLPEIRSFSEHINSQNENKQAKRRPGEYRQKYGGCIEKGCPVSAGKKKINYQSEADH